MLKRFSANYMAVLFLVDGILFQVSLALALVTAGLAWNRFPDVRGWIALFWCIAFLILDVYNPHKGLRWTQEYQRVLLAHMAGILMLAGTLFLLDIALSRQVFLIHGLISTGLIFGYRSLLRAWYRYHRRRNERLADVHRVLVINGGDVGLNFAREFRNMGWDGMQIVGFLDDDRAAARVPELDLPVLGPLDRVRSVVERFQVKSVVIALPRWEYRRIAILVTELSDLPVWVYVVPDYFELAFFNFTVGSLGGIPVIGLREPAIDGFQRMVKRIADLVLGSLLVVLCLPILLVVSVAIKLEDGGAVFYFTERVGENQRIFRMLKFRSMVMNASARQEEVNQYDDAGNLIHKRVDDPRVTRVGKWIRRHSVDELPNLWNVLKGEMSLVGPRPELPWLVERYEPWQLKRFVVPQGMTGWWQVTGRSDKPMHLHTDDDIYYIQNYSLWLDIQILWRTIAVVIRGEGAY